MVRLGEVLTFIRGITFKPEEKIEASHPDAVVCMRTKNIQEELDESDLIAVPKALVKREELFLKQGDILISSANSWNLVGKVVQVSRLDYQATAGGFISILRPVLDKVLPDYLYLFINSEQVQHDIRLLGKQTTNISNLDRKRFLELEIPLPPVSVQKRMSEVLMQCGALLKQSIKIKSELNALSQAIFLDMFGDPVINDKGWRTKKLADVVSITSGGTPSKSNDSYWSGDFPWVSPKDMKVDYLFDAQDHISDIVFKETNLKKIPTGRILIVVRGMILSHSVPLAMNLCDIAINQDIKALEICDENLVAEFVFECLKNQKEHVLSKVSTAAHGTKRLDSPDLLGLEIITPPIEQQKEFVGIMQKNVHLSETQKQKISEYELFLNSLIQRAFSGNWI